MQIEKLGAAALLCGALLLGGCGEKAGNGAAGEGGAASARSDSAGGGMDPDLRNVSTDTQKIDSGGEVVRAEDN